jgi:hypothetical protein
MTNKFTLYKQCDAFYSTAFKRIRASKRDAKSFGVAYELVTNIKKSSVIPIGCGE